MSDDFNCFTKSELTNLCRDRNIKIISSYTKNDLVKLLNGKEIKKKFKCDLSECYFSCNSSGDLTIHKRTHTGEKPYKCDYGGCDFKSSSSGKLSIHKNKHTGEKSYKCNFNGCNYSSVYNSSLVSHKKNHTGEKPYKCDYDSCLYSTTGSSALKVHKRTHTGEKPYKCDFDGCDYKTTGTSSLITHKRIHTGERPYKCDYGGCDYTCIQNGDLITHKRIHTGEKPYKCDFDGCDYTCSTNTVLIKHERIHTGEKPYKCDYEGCDFKCIQSGALTIHKKIHTKEGQRRQKRSEHYTLSYLEKYIEIKREHQVDFTCNGGTFCRLDGLSLHKNKNGKAFIIVHENDEHQHEGYAVSCETRRMTDVKSVFLQDGNDIPIFFIRYNPDSFMIDGNIQNIKKEERMKKYIDLIRNLENSNEELIPLTIYYLFYDIICDKLKVFFDKDYPIELKKNVKFLY
jgi:uncharacterized Zn-finger protein